MFTRKLLTREQFKAVTLGRCGGLCCVPGCGQPAVDAHHIIERRLWSDGGYTSDNGAPLCAEHHLQAETTAISVEDLRTWCGIKAFVLPDQFVQDDKIDKWGNQILPNGMRLRGELFHDEAVQKALALGGFLGIFELHAKHPRTPHLPYSPGATSDDRILGSIEHFEGMDVVMTEKRDGECTTVAADRTFARSRDSKSHPSRDWLKGQWAVWRHDIPEGWRVVGESLYARHSVAYADLDTYFEGFMLWNDATCLSWDETVEWFSLIGASAGMPIKPVPVIYRGPYSRDAVETAWRALLQRDREAAERTGKPVQEREGFVIRLSSSFTYRDFGRNVAKWVRQNHVTTSKHWMHEAVVPNRLVTDDEN